MGRKGGSSPPAPGRLRAVLVGLLPLLRVLSAVFMLWKAACVLADTPYPVMIVTTESMEPAFQPGDVLFMSNHHGPVHAGDLPVCWLSNRQLPMIHRVVRVTNQEHHDPGKRQLILTKGDNNEIDDGLMYPGRGYIYRHEIVGFVRIYVPLIGWPAILMHDVGRARELYRRLSGDAY